MMASHADILDRPERLWGSFWSSIALHVSIAAVVLGVTWVRGHRPAAFWGDINGGGMGSVAVNVVSRIPLPTQGGQQNPVANDTQSRAPEPPPAPKAKPQPRVKEPDLDAIPLPSRNAVRKPSQAASAPNKFRAQQQDLPNQVYSQSGQRLVTPMIGMSGGGGVGIGTNSPFGTQFGWYSDQVRSRVAQNWHTGDIDARIRAANPVVVTFTIQRDGSVPSQSVRVTQSSGISELDISAKRAILMAVPFQPLPQQFGRNSADVEFYFELRR
jgi:protein TonB